MQTISAEHFQIERTYINPLPVRIWHWANALGFIMLILTGVQIRYVGLINVLSFETAVNVHNWVGFAAIANFLIWLVFYLFTDKIKVYHPELDAKKFFLSFFEQARYYSYGIFRGEKSPHHVRPHDKFNPMQSMTYQILMLLIVPIQFVTGILMWDVKRFEYLSDMMGGIRVVSTIHILIFILFVFFILVHAYMGALGRKPSTHYKEMFTGYEEED